MKKLLFLIALLAGITLPLQAQTQHYEDVVYLKNGSIIRGIIIEQIPNVSLKIQTRDKNIFVYKIEEVEKITKELMQRQAKQQTISSDYSSFNKPKGYMGLVELEGGLGIGTWAATRTGVVIINGYRVIPQFAFGVGIGTKIFTHSFDYVGHLEVGMPLFLHLRGDFLDEKVSPYAAFNIGYNLSLIGGFFGGILMEPSVGVGFNIDQRKSRMNIGVAVAINRVKYIVDYGYGGYYEGKAMGYALNLKVGFSF